MPRCALAKSALAKTTKSPASREFEIHDLVPSSTHSPDAASSVAEVLSANASEPLPASERQNDPTVSAHIRGRYRSFCAGVAYLLAGKPAVRRGKEAA
jgi:hypothetical protein